MPNSTTVNRIGISWPTSKPKTVAAAAISLVETTNTRPTASSGGAAERAGQRGPQVRRRVLGDLLLRRSGEGRGDQRDLPVAGDVGGGVVGHGDDARRALV